MFLGLPSHPGCLSKKNLPLFGGKNGVELQYISENEQQEPQNAP